MALIFQGCGEPQGLRKVLLMNAQNVSLSLNLAVKSRNEDCVQVIDLEQFRNRNVKSDGMSKLCGSGFETRFATLSTARYF